MASCYISEYATVGAPGPDGTTFQAPKEPAITEQLVAITGSSTQSAPFSTATRMVMVSLDNVASLAFGPNPTAITTAKRLPQNAVLFFVVNPGDRLAAILNV